MQARSVLKAIATGLVTGAVPGVVGLLFGSISLHDFPYWIMDGIVFGLLIGVPCQLMGPVIGCRVRDYSRPARIAVVFSWLLVIAVLGTAVGTAILMPTGNLGPGGFLSHYGWMLRMSLMITFTVGVVAWVVVSLQMRLSQAQEELHRRQMAEEQANKMAVEARIASLESRIHPHFLFNTLNSISALVREDPVQAERTIERLAALLRASLDSENAGLVTLREELAVVRDYLDIEQVRFGQRLRYRIEAEPAAESLAVPALSIQTLAENSVKYAVGVRANGAEIVITATVRDGRLRVEVADDGPGFPAEAEAKPGHGIDLLRRRLSALFGASASLELGQREGRTLVSISVAA